MKKVLSLILFFVILLLSSCSKVINEKEKNALNNIIEECDYEKNSSFFLYYDGLTRNTIYIYVDNDSYYFYLNDDKYLYNKETSEIFKNDTLIVVYKCNKKVDFINYIMDMTEENEIILSFEEVLPLIKESFSSNEIVKGRMRHEYNYKKSYYYSVEIDIDTLKNVSWYDKFELFAYESLDSYSDEKIELSIRASIPDRMVDSFLEISINNNDLLSL